MAKRSQRRQQQTEEEALVKGSGEISEYLEEYDYAKECFEENQKRYTADRLFALHDEQWPPEIKQARMDDKRPCLTINKLPQFLNQVINDGRMKRPSMKAHPVDSRGDPETAIIIDGLVRQIEYDSRADIAYDTGLHSAVSGGFGYWRIVLEHAWADAFDLDIRIKRIPNALNVIPDPSDQEGDGSDWNIAFVLENYTKREFQRKWGDAAQVDWDDDNWRKQQNWKDEKGCVVAERWSRDFVDTPIVLVEDIRSQQTFVYEKEFIEGNDDIKMLLANGFLRVLRERVSERPKVKQCIMSGAEILEENKWPGSYIPIIPVYGEEYWHDNERVLKGLIHRSKDSNRMYNYWRSAATELTALAPKVPWIGPRGTFSHEADKWESSNTRNWPTIEYEDMGTPPQRQPLDPGRSIGATSEALAANDDIKSTIGMYDASLGARSNETSGKAINARKSEGDVGSFHFLDNQSRAIVHTGNVIVDLIPHVYNTARIIQILGRDNKQTQVQVNRPVPQKGPDGKPVVDERGRILTKIHDLRNAKYNVRMVPGPSYTTSREETREQIMAMISQAPDLMLAVGDILVRNFDWDGAEEIAERLKQLQKMKMGEIPPELKKVMGEMQRQVQRLTAENEALKADRSIDKGELSVKQFEAQTDRLALGIDKMQAETDMVSKLVLPQLPKGLNGNA